MILPARLAAQGSSRDGSLSESAAFLLVPVGARAVGLGGAMAAARGQIESVFWNPAGTAGLESTTLYYIRSNDLGTQTDILGGMGRFGRIRAGASFYLFDLGSIDATDAGGNDLGSLDLRNQAFVLTASGSLGGRLDLGISYKLVQFVSSCTGSCGEFAFTSTDHAIDLGAVLVVPRTPGIRVGAALTNLGLGKGSLDGSAGDPLPTRIRAGFALPVLRLLGDPLARGGPSPVTGTLHADVQETWTEFDHADFFLGSELGYEQIVFVRLGYAWVGDARSGPTLGVGVHADRFRIDLGHSFNDFSGFSTSTPYQLSVAVGL